MESHSEEIKALQQKIIQLQKQNIELKEKMKEESWVKIIADKSDNVVKLIEGFGRQYNDGKNAELKFNVSMGRFALFVVLIIVGSAGVLTYFGKIDGSAFSFLLGTVVGSVLLFLRESIF